METPSDQPKKNQVIVMMNADWLGGWPQADVDTWYFLLSSYVFSFEVI